MISLVMCNFPDGTSEPICLEIDDITYTYPDDELFKHLLGYIGSEIKLITQTTNSHTSKMKIIKEVFIKDGVYHAYLEDLC